MKEYEVMLSGDYSYTVLVEANSEEEAKKEAKEYFRADKNQIPEQFFIRSPEFIDIY